MCGLFAVFPIVMLDYYRKIDVPEEKKTGPAAKASTAAGKKPAAPAAPHSQSSSPFVVCMASVQCCISVIRSLYLPAHSASAILHAALGAPAGSAGPQSLPSVVSGVRSILFSCISAKRWKDAAAIVPVLQVRTSVKVLNKFVLVSSVKRHVALTA